MDKTNLIKNLKKLQEILLKNHSVLRAARIHDTLEYERLRTELFEEPELRQVLPEFLEEYPDFDDFLSYRSRVPNLVEFMKQSLQPAFEVLAGTTKPMKLAEGKSILPKLRWSLAVSQEKLDEQLSQGIAIKSRTFSDNEDIDKGFDDTERWTRFTHALLLKMFGSDSTIADEFSEWINSGYDNDVTEARMNPTFQQKVDFLRGNISPKTNRLQSIRERLELYEEETQAPVTTGSCVQEISNTIQRTLEMNHIKQDQTLEYSPIDFVIITAL
ncbi:MAG: hypothetical protein K2X81_10100, partial [Candidatus Obscuribacterales bacterium]|nr:hypothetical protein [Candidatus Obscuribacterales bacterium]